MPISGKFWLNKPKYDFIKVATTEAEADFYHNKKYNPNWNTGESVGLHCIAKSCEKFPQTVCEACVEYICEDHIHRHPNCEEGR